MAKFIFDTMFIGWVVGYLLWCLWATWKDRPPARGSKEYEAQRRKQNGYDGGY